MAHGLSKVVGLCSLCEGYVQRLEGLVICQACDAVAVPVSLPIIQMRPREIVAEKNKRIAEMQRQGDKHD